MRTLALVTLLAAAPAAAQEVAAAPSAEAHATASGGGIDRGGLYLGFGLGFGGSNLAQEAIAGAGSAQLGFRIGGAITPQVLVGLETMLSGQYNQWEPASPAAAAMSSVLAQGMFFPVASLPLNVAAGVGWGSGLAVDRIPNNTSGDPRALAKGSNGVAWMGGVGWDFFAGRGWNLGLQARYDGASLPDLKTVHGGSLAIWLNNY